MNNQPPYPTIGDQEIAALTQDKPGNTAGPPPAPTTASARNCLEVVSTNQPFRLSESWYKGPNGSHCLTRPGQILSKCCLRPCCRYNFLTYFPNVSGPQGNQHISWLQHSRREGITSARLENNLASRCPFSLIPSNRCSESTPSIGSSPAG